MKSTSAGKCALQIYFQGATANARKMKPVVRKYRLVHRGWQEDIVCGDCNQDLDREKRQG